MTDKKNHNIATDGEVIEESQNQKKGRINKALKTKDINKILESNTGEFLKKFYGSIIENLRVPGYYFDKEMIEKLFSNEGLTMIDFKKTIYHKSTFLGKECMELDEESYGDNEKHVYYAKINESTKSIEIYIDGGNNGKPNHTVKYNEQPNENNFNTLRRLNTLYMQNRDYEYTCRQIKGSKHLYTYFIHDRERRRRYSEEIDNNFNVLKNIDDTIKMEDNEYKDFMLQLDEFTHLSKNAIRQIYQSMSKEYLEGSVEKKKEIDELAVKKIHLFDKFPGYDKMTLSRGAFESLPGVRPYILLKYLQYKTSCSDDYVLEKYSNYIGSIKTEDMDPNDERIKEINSSIGYIVARFMNRD